MTRSKMLKPSHFGQPKPDLKAKENALYPKAKALGFTAWGYNGSYRHLPQFLNCNLA